MIRLILLVTLKKFFFYIYLDRIFKDDTPELSSSLRHPTTVHQKAVVIRTTVVLGGPTGREESLLGQWASVGLAAPP